LNVGADQSPIFARLLSPINFEFVLGMGVACLARTISNRLALASLCIGVVTIILLLVWPSAKEYRVLFVVPFSLLLLGAVLLEYQNKLLFSRWMVLLGDASYSIYLIHNPLLSITSRIVGKLHNFASWGLSMLVGVAASVVIGVLYHFFIERPLIGLFRTQI
jgi:peptidoglycan/LPS O-acetylase OafA/YrhL